MKKERPTPEEISRLVLKSLGIDAPTIGEVMQIKRETVVIAEDTKKDEKQ